MTVCTDLGLSFSGPYSLDDAKAICDYFNIGYIMWSKVERLIVHKYPETCNMNIPKICLIYSQNPDSSMDVGHVDLVLDQNTYFKV